MQMLLSDFQSKIINKLYLHPNPEEILNEMSNIYRLPSEEFSKHFYDFFDCKIIMGANESDIRNILASLIAFTNHYITLQNYKDYLYTFYMDICLHNRNQLQDSPLLLSTLSGVAFEDFMAKLYYVEGYIVEKTQASHDGGVDLILHPNNYPHLTYYVQCKGSPTGKAVSSSVIRDLYGTIKEANVNGGFIATTTYLSPDAIQFINRHIDCQILNHDFNYIVSTLNKIF